MTKPNKTQNAVFDSIRPIIDAANIDYGVSMFGDDYYFRRRHKSDVYNLLIRPDGTLYFVHQKHGVKIAEREFDTNAEGAASYFLDPNDVGAGKK